MKHPAPAALLVATLAAGSAACRAGKTAPPAPPQASAPEAAAAPSTQAPGDLTAAATTPGPQPAEARASRRSYEEAKRAVWDGDLERAIAALDLAIQDEPDFAEAWYQRGAAKMNLAIERIDQSEAEALALARAAVQDKREASGLIAIGATKLWTPDETAQAVSDLENGLADADEAMADDERLAAALRIWADSRR